MILKIFSLKDEAEKWPSCSKNGLFLQKLDHNISHFFLRKLTEIAIVTLTPAHMLVALLVDIFLNYVYRQIVEVGGKRGLGIQFTATVRKEKQLSNAGLAQPG
jgi:hypothetical protein